MIEKNKKEIEEKILEKIDSEHIEPISKWKLSLRGIVFWLFGIITIFIGSISVSASIFVFNNIKWEFYKATHNNIFTFTIEFLPYFWLFSLIIFLAITHKIIRNTKRGYKYNFSKIIVITMIITIILGLLFSKIGFGEVIENKISQKFPFYFGIHRQNLIKWNNPEQGLLIGKIIKQDDNFILKTFENYEWKLIYEDYYKDILDKIDKNEFVRIIGSSEDENFYVCEILLQGEQPEFRRRDMAERKNNFMRSIGCEEILPYKRLFKNRITN